MKHLNFLTLAIAAATAVAIQSCQIEDLDVNAIDTNITLLKGVDIPVLEQKEFKLSDFLKLDDSDGVISIDPETNEYLINYSVGTQNVGGFTLDASKMSLAASESASNSINLSVDEIPIGIPVSYDPEDREFLISMGMDLDLFDELSSQVFEFETDVNFSTNNFPDLITAVRSSQLEGNLTLKLVPKGIPFSKFTLNAGSLIQFPEFVKIAAGNGFNVSADGHTLTSLVDIQIPVNQGVELTVGLTALDMGESGVATSGSLTLSDAISVSGTISCSPDDFTGSTQKWSYAGCTATVTSAPYSLSNFRVETTFKADNVKLKSAVVKLSDSAAPSFNTSYSFIIENLPEFLNDANIGLAQFQVGMEVDNSLPVAFDLQAGLTAYKDGASTHEHNIGPLSFPAMKNTVYSVGEHADGTVGDVIYKQIKGLGNLLNPIPDKITAGNFRLNLAKGWIEAEAGKEYDVKFNIGIKTPVSFTADSKVSIGTETEDLNLDLGGDYVVKKAIVKLTAVNTIPLNFEVAVTAKDASGNVLDGVTASLNKVIAGGTATSPATTDVEITLTLPQNTKVIKTLKIDLDASSSESLAAKPLAANQGLTLKNVAFYLPDGVQTNLKNN